jgi:hypothetical protein
MKLLSCFQKQCFQNNASKNNASKTMLPKTTLSNTARFLEIKQGSYFWIFKYIPVLDVRHVKILDHENTVQDNLKFSSSQSII